MEWVDLSLLAAPMVAGLLVLSTHVPLGMEVLRRGILFIDLAVAQVAALGVIAAGLLHFEALAGSVGVQLAAGLAALAAAGLLAWTERRWPGLQEALIGLVFVLASALGILLLAGNPHAGERLRDLLVGQILWVDWRALFPVAVLYAGVLAGWRWLHERGKHAGLGFYLLFAVAVTASLQLVGVYLVFASLVAPAVATAGAARHRVALAFALGTVSYGVGLLASLMFDLPAGAAIACVLVLAAFGGLGFVRAR